MLILVTGATGYIASRLIPRLLDAGHRVRALARDPRRLDGRGWTGLVEIFRGDVMDPASLAPALDGVHTAYYLIHNMLSGRGYTERELEGARNFASACESAGVKHIVYLGGLADPEQHIAPHLRSRIETGRVLRQGSVPVTEFRAGVIVGSGSMSFEMIRFMTELFSVVPGPTWLSNLSQPIAVQNVIDYLLAALDNWNGHGQVFEIGGAETVPYKTLMLKYAQARGLKRSMILFPYIPLCFMAFGVGLITPVPRPIAYALIGGLSADSVVKHPEARTVFPEVNLIDFDAAAREALTHLHPDRIERVWESGERLASLKHEGLFILHQKGAARNDIPHLSEMAGFHIVPEGYPAPQIAPLGNWQVESREPCRILFHRSRAFGEEWLEWRVSPPFSSLRDGVLPSKQSPDTGPALIWLIHTYCLAPRGLGGFLYWYLLYPFRNFFLRGLIRAIAKKAEKQEGK